MSEEYVKQILEPLSEETKQLLKPCSFRDSDFLHISLEGHSTDSFVLKIFGIHPTTGERGFPSVAAANWWLERIPERKPLVDYGEWKIAATDFNALIINALWAKDHLTFEDDARVVYYFLLSRFFHQTENAQIRARFEAADDHMAEWFANRVSSNFIDNAEFPLAPYQTLALRGAYKEDGFALFMEQGTGKTPVTIARICNESQEFDRMYRTIIVCPKNVRANWRSEFIKFATVPGRVTVLRGTQLDRVKQLIEAFKPGGEARWTAVVCSYESVSRSWDALCRIQWDLGVLDESHFIKSPYAKRAWKCLELRNLCNQRMALTGTPITNSLLDLFMQLEWLGKGLSGFHSWKKFRTYYGKWVKRSRFETLIGHKNVPILQERLARLSFMIKKEKALPDLPDKVYDICEVSMGEEQLLRYKQVKTELAIEVEADLANAEDAPNKQLLINNILVKMLRLAQITSGFISWDAIVDDDGNEIQPKTIDRFDPNPKIEAIVEILKTKGPCDKTVVWACWVADIKTLAARLKLEGINCVVFYGGTKDRDRDEAVRRFNDDPMCSVFVANPAAGGVGLNLLGYDTTNLDDPCNCNHEIYMSQNWSMVHRCQSEDRCHRRGTRVNIRITDLCVPNTIDEEIRKRVTAKIDSACSIQDVREILNRVLENLPLVNGDD